MVGKVTGRKHAAGKRVAVRQGVSAVVVVGDRGGGEAGGEVAAAGDAAGSARAKGETWHDVFLDHLAATAHVEQSAKKAGITATGAYAARRRQAWFAEAWHLALLAGYDRLEAALIRKALGQSHEPVVDCAATGEAAAAGEIDVPVAMQLLARHRPTVERASKEREAKAFRATRDEAEAALISRLRNHARRRRDAQ